MHREDRWGSWYRGGYGVDDRRYILLSITNKMQRYKIFFIAVNAVHVSGGFSVHHQELKTVPTASGICQACLLLPLAWLSWNNSTCFRRFSRPLSGAQKCTHSIWYMWGLLADTASVGELFKLTHASGSSKQAWHIPDAVGTVLSSWWWAEKPLETCRALTAINNIV